MLSLFCSFNLLSARIEITLSFSLYRPHHFSHFTLTNFIFNVTKIGTRLENNCDKETIYEDGIFPKGLWKNVPIFIR